VSRSEAPLESFGEREPVDFQTEETHCAILVAATGRVEATGHEGTRDEAADPKLELGGDLEIANRSDRHLPTLTTMLSINSLFLVRFGAAEQVRSFHG
jgi:hypothetical protein